MVVAATVVMNVVPIVNADRMKIHFAPGQICLFGFLFKSMITAWVVVVRAQ